MLQYIFKCVPKTDIDFYMKKLVFVGGISNFSILSALLVADYRYFTDYRF